MKTFGRITKGPRKANNQRRRKSSVSSGDLSALVAQQEPSYDGPMTRSRAPARPLEEAHQHQPSCSYSDDTAALVTPPSPQSFLSTGTTDLRALSQDQQQETTPSVATTTKDNDDDPVGSFLDRLEARLERSLETARARDKYGFDFETDAPLAGGPIEWTRALPS